MSDSFTPVIACVAAFLGLAEPYTAPHEQEASFKRVCERHPGTQDPRRPAADGEPWQCEAILVKGNIHGYRVWYPQWPPKKIQRAFGAAWWVMEWNEVHPNFPRMWEAAFACEAQTPIATDRWVPPPTPLTENQLKAFENLWKFSAEHRHRVWRGEVEP